MKENVSMLRNEHGSAGLKAIVAFAILGAFIYVAVQLFPILWDHWDLEDSIETKVKFAFINHPNKVKEHLTSEITRLLKDIDAQYKKENLRIDVDEKQKRIVVKIWYSREHKVPYYPPNPWPFYIEITNN
jgi:hypothetical protein